MNLQQNFLSITLKNPHCNPNKGPDEMTLIPVRSRKVAVHCLLLLALISAFSNACGGLPPQHDTAIPQEVHHLTVLFTNDSHGHPVKFSTHSVPDEGGLPAPCHPRGRNPRDMPERTPSGCGRPEHRTIGIPIFSRRNRTSWDTISRPMTQWSWETMNSTIPAMSSKNR